MTDLAEEDKSNEGPQETDLGDERSGNAGHFEGFAEEWIVPEHVFTSRSTINLLQEVSTSRVWVVSLFDSIKGAPH